MKVWHALCIWYVLMYGWAITVDAMGYPLIGMMNFLTSLICAAGLLLGSKKELEQKLFESNNSEDIY